MRAKKGFTLVELILSLVILSMLFGTMYFALGTQLRLWQKIVSAAERQQVINAVLTRIVNDIRAAREILPGSDYQALSLKIGEDVVEYALIDQKVRRKKNGSSSYLTEREELPALSFSYPDIKRVKIEVDGLETGAALRN